MNKVKHCSQCGNEYGAQRSTSKFCSALCRKLAFQADAKVSVPGEKSLSVPSEKRGKDIKCFSDLPPDVQQTIDRLSVVDGKIDQHIKAKRTAIAINYQHQFPGKFEPHWFSAAMVAGVTGKPGDADYNGICTEAWRAEQC